MAHRLVAGQFPEFAGFEPTWLGRGWDNACIEYPGGEVFRFPMRGEGLATLQNELRLLPAARPFIALSAPEFLWFGQPGLGYPWPFVGYRKVIGDPWRTPGPTAPAVLGRFLRRLQECPVDSWPQTPDKTLPGPRFEALARRCRALADADPAEGSFARAVEDRAKGCLVDRRTLRRTALHGDLRPMHILFASDGSPTGVIDWGDIQAGHPACDLSIGFTFFSGQARQEFFEAVGGCSSGDREAALLRALGYGPALMHYGIEESDEEMVRRGREIGLRTLS